MTNPIKTKAEEWEVRFDKKFGDSLEINEGMTGLAVEEYHSPAKKKVLAFLSEELDNQKNEDIKFIGKLKREWYQKGVNEQKKEMIERIEKKRANHTKKGINPLHDSGELYCCLECHGDSIKNQALDDIIQALKK